MSPSLSQSRIDGARLNYLCLVLLRGAVFAFGDLIDDGNALCAAPKNIAGPALIAPSSFARRSSAGGGSGTEGVDCAAEPTLILRFMVYFPHS
jgi:hypothetical protein